MYFFSKDDSFLSRYRLVPYGNHSYLESLTDKSKVWNEFLLYSLFFINAAFFKVSPNIVFHSGTATVLFGRLEVLLGQ